MSIIENIFHMTNINKASDIIKSDYDDKTKAYMLQTFVNNTTNFDRIDVNIFAIMMYCDANSISNKISFDAIQELFPNASYIIILMIIHVLIQFKKI